MLLSGASRIAYSPDTDDGAEFEDDPDEGEEFEEGDDPDEGEDPEDGEDEGDDPDDGEEPAPKPKSRGDARIQSILEREKAEKTRADRAEAELAASRRGPTVSPEEAARRRSEHLQGLSAEDRLEFLRKEGEQRIEGQLQQIRFDSWDANDKGDFAKLCARNPAVAALESEVEKRIKDLRAQGQNVSREVMAKYVLGEKALAKAPRANAKGKRTEAAGRERQSGRPANGRGDVAPAGNRRGKGNDIAALEDRLRGVKI